MTKRKNSGKPRRPARPTRTTRTGSSGSRKSGSVGGRAQSSGRSAGRSSGLRKAVERAGSGSAARGNLAKRRIKPPANTPRRPQRTAAEIRAAQLRRAAARAARAQRVERRTASPTSGVASMPRPRVRTPRTYGAPAGTNPQLQASINQVQSTFARLESSSQLSSIYEDIGEIETRLTQLPLELDALRERGFVHAGQLEERIDAFDAQWDEVEPRVRATLQQTVSRLDREVDETERAVNALSAANPSALANAQRAVNGLEQQIRSAASGVSNLYQGVLNELNQIGYQLGRVDWMLDTLEGAADIVLYDAEGPLAAVEAEWQRNGEEGPDGYLYLTDQRLLFEQREEIAKKKFLGLVTTEKETLQGLLLDVPIGEIESVVASEQGGFMGMGKDDILELVFSAQAPVSRARFKLDGQESSDWAKLLKRIQSGDIDEDRADDYVEALEEASSLLAAFPTNCPNCLATLPPPPRGVSSVTCEFCGSTVVPSAG